MTSVLALDDEEQYGSLICEVSEMYDIEAKAIQNPFSLEVVFADNPNITLIFLDINMPNRDGIEVLRAIAKMNYKGAVVLMTGVDESVLIAAQELAHEHKIRLLPSLTKPFSIQKVSEILNSESLKSSMKTDVIEDCEETLLTKSSILSLLEDKRIQMNYQPQISLSNYQVIGAESLVRLIDKNGNLIFPRQFIEVAEKEEITHILTDAVISQFCEDYKTHLHELKGLTYSINISALELNNLSFPDEVQKKLHEYGINPSQIVIEVTETHAIEQMKTGLDTLTRLRLKNFHLSIDDFGTGSAVISNIKRMPFTELKIDKSFIDKIFSDKRTRSLTKDLIYMGHHMNLNLVAEGVEDIDTVELLKEMGCDIVQGYYFAKPMQAADLVSWLNTQTNDFSRTIDDQDLPNYYSKPFEKQDELTKHTIDSLVSQNHETRPTGKNHNLAMILPLTGSLSALGKIYFFGANMAFKKFMSDNGLDDRDFSLSVYDSQSDSDYFFRLLDRAIPKEITSFVGGIFPLSDTKKVIELSKKRNIPYFAPYSGCVSLRNTDHQHIFNLKASYGDELLKLLGMAEKEGGNTCLILNQSPMGKTLHKQVQKDFPNVKVMFSKSSAENNLQNLISQLKTNNAYNIVTVCSQKLFINLILQYRAINSNAYFYTVSLVPVSTMNNLLGLNSKNVFFASPVPSLEENLPIIHEFKSCLADLHIVASKRLINSITLEGYISMKMTLALLNELSSNAPDLISALNDHLDIKSKINIGTSCPMSWNRDNRSFYPSVHVFEYKDGVCKKRLSPSD